MNIVIVGTAYPYRGGLAAYNERLANELLVQGYNVEIVTFTLQYPKFLFPGKTQFSNEKPPTSLKISRMINSINPFSWVKTAKFIIKKQPDIVVFSYWTFFMSPCFGKIAQKIKKQCREAKCIGLVHNMIPHEPSVFDKSIPKYFVNKMDAFIALSKSVVEDIKTFDKNNKNIVYSPHPIYDHYGKIINKSDAKSILGLDQDNSYILFFGLVRMYKGLDLLINALADKRLIDNNIKLIVAGEFYDDPDYYYEIIEKRGLQGHVLIYNEFIADSAIKYYFSAADIIAQPYKTATQSGVTQIAYHFNKPMLVTNVGGLPEIVPNGKAGYVVEPNEKAIADALVDFFINDKEDEFTENVKTEKKRFSWSVFADALISTVNTDK